MPTYKKYNEGDIQCSVEKLADGRFQGKVFVAGSVLDRREPLIFLCPEIDSTREDAMRRAIDYVDASYPPGQSASNH